MVSQSSRLDLASPAIAVAGAPLPADEVLTRRCDHIAIAVLALAALVASLTFRDFGLGWDDYAHAEYGDLLVAFYKSGFADQRALSFVNLYMYGGGFDLLAALVAKLLPFTIFETRRLVGAAVGIVGLVAAWRTARRLGGSPAGLATVLLLVTCPLYVGHLFINAKDGPFAVAMAILLLALVRSFDEYPRPSLGTLALLAIGLGLSIGSRVMGGFAVIAALGALAFAFALDARVDGLRPAAVRLGRFALTLLPAAVAAYVVMGIVWPWAIVDPLNPFRALGYFSHFFEQPWHELFGGKFILVPDMPRNYVPTLFGLQLPELFVVLALGGGIGALVAAFRSERPSGARAALVLLVLSALLPLAVTIALRPAMYNGVRHFVFVLPPLAVLGGLAAAWLFERARQRGPAIAVLAAIVFAAGTLSPVVEMARLHPFEYTHFNRIAGGVRSARGRFMLDYWALSFKQASQGLAARLSELGLKRPADRRWKLATCGPHRSPQVELGPDFETTWDPQGADFALMLGEFYCVKFDAPVLVEVAREGVVYARVYDIRGRSYPSLLTMPGVGG